MKRGKKLLSSLLAALLLATMAPVKTQAADGWVQSGSNWYYYKNNQSVKGWMKDGWCWYFLDYNTGVMKTGWVADGSTWYYLGPSGVMQSDYWVVEDGQKYYVDETGAMATGESVVYDEKDSTKKLTCTFASNGLLTGECKEYTEPEEAKGEWKKEGSNYYYYINGVKQKGWITINDKTYYLGGNDYHMYWGIQTINGKKYEFANNGALIGEITSDYFDEYDNEDYYDEKEELVTLIDDLRYDEDLDSLVWIDEDDLDLAAYVRAGEIADDYIDERPDDETLDDLLEECDAEYEYVEEFYVEATSAAKAYRALTANRTIKRALLDDEHNVIAIGIVDDIYVVLLGIDGEIEEEKDSESGDIVDYINYYREEADVYELDTLDELDEAAEEIALAYAKAFVAKKEDPDYDAILEDNDVSYANSDMIFVDDVEEYDDYEEIVDDWMTSRSYKKKLTDEDFTHVGVGVVTYNKTEYIAVVFIEEEDYESDASYYDEDKEEILEYINDEREWEDLDTLDLADDELDEAAYDLVLSIIDGTAKASKYKDFLDDYEVEYASATYIYTKGVEDYDYEALVEGWMASSTTANKLLGEDYTRAGIGIEEKNDVLYVVVLLIEDDTTTSSSSSSEFDQDKADVIELVNYMRMMAGATSLDEGDDDVMDIADARAYEIARYGKTENTLSADMKKEKISGAKEIIVEDCDSVFALVSTIKTNSTLLGNYDEIVIGAATYKGVTCWSIIVY